MNISKGAFVHVENELFTYDETKREIESMREEILFGRSSYDENVGGGRSSLPGDPTGSTATALVSNRTLEQMERIVNAIDLVFNRLPQEKQELVRLKYWTQPQTLTWDGIALELNVSRRQALRWRDGIVTAIALKMGWR